MNILEDGPELRANVATACWVLAARGLVEGALGHVSARVSSDEIVIRCRGPHDGGLCMSDAGDVWRVTLDGDPVDLPEGYVAPKELPLHTELLRARPSLAAVVHAHPRSALLCGLAGLNVRPVFGAYNIPAMRLALRGVPIFPKMALVTRPELAREVVAAMAAETVIGVGRYAESRATSSLKDLGTRISSCWHPSPASPLANRNGGADWRANVLAVLP